ncbi:MAG: hypothetical protein KAR13_07435 [Desulfobulbaceae bacterium]|nr:hypothetical protein [Desulfobulbaceae bacterium]
MDQEFIELILGAVFLSVHAYDRFNTPPTNRASTTAVRYHTAAVTYFSIYLCIYYVLTKYPSLLGVLAAYDGGGSSEEIGSVVKTLQELSPALLVALLLTVLLPRIPMLSSIDNWLRAYLKERAAIPYEARRLSKELRNAKFNVSQDMRDKIHVALVEDGFEPRNIVFDESDQPEYRWTKIAVLMAHLESEWESDRKFAGYIHSFSNHYRLLKDSYKRLSVKAKTCFRLNREILLGGEDQQIHDAILECTANYKEQCNELLKNLCDFISRGVLKCQITHSSRWHALSAMGFKEPDTGPGGGPTINQVLTLLVILVPVLLLNFALFGSRLPENVLLMGTMIATIYTMAVMCALYPKGIWKFTRRDEHGTRPMLFYLVAGFAAVALAVPVSLVFKFFIFSISEEQTMATAFLSAWNDFSMRSYRWMLMAFITAFFTAFHLDNRPFWKITCSRLRWIEGFVQAAVNLSAAYIVVCWLDDQNLRDRLICVLGTTAVIGFVIGFVVPHWYRDAPRQQETVLDTD